MTFADPSSGLAGPVMQGRTQTPVSPRQMLGYSLLGLLLLLTAWEVFARGNTQQRQDAGLVIHAGVLLDGSNNDALGRTLAEIPETGLPRILMLGSSQIRTVARATHPHSHTSTPFRLHAALRGYGVSHQIIDFSAGGQLLVESMAIYFASAEIVSPAIVVLGVGVFAMQDDRLRDGLAEDLDLAQLATAIDARLPDSTDAAVRARLLAFRHQASRANPSRGKTLQQRADRSIGDWLSARVAAIRNRSTLYNRLIHLPLRRDLVRFVQRRFLDQQTARTYGIGEAYPVSLAAISAMSALADASRTDLIVVVLPYDHTRPPIPYTDETQEQLLSGLRALAHRENFGLVDLSGFLGTTHFSNNTDGSPDNLHYDASAHEALAEEISKLVLPLLAARTDEPRHGAPGGTADVP